MLSTSISTLTLDKNKLIYLNLVKDIKPGERKPRLSCHTIFGDTRQIKFTIRKQIQIEKAAKLSDFISNYIWAPFF